MTIQNSKNMMIEFLGTPEAGKTTTIHRLQKELSKKYTISIMQEAAEIVPSYFPKGSIAAHFWMRLNTAKNILEYQFSTDSEVLLIDRGLFDTLFWNYYYSSISQLSTEVAQLANKFFQNIGIKNPDLVVYLSTKPDEAINRRGGEGRIVTLDFLKNFNSLLDEFIKTIPVPVFHLDTTGLSKDDVFKEVLHNLPL